MGKSAKAARLSLLKVAMFHLYQKDLFLGYYDSSVFSEIQLTNTPYYSEFQAHSALGESYIHYAWTSSVYQSTGTYNLYKTNIFYNRTLLSDLPQLIKKTQLQSPRVNKKRSSISNYFDYLSNFKLNFMFCTFLSLKRFNNDSSTI